MIETMKVVFAKINSGWKVYAEEATGDNIPDDYIVYKFPPASSSRYRDDLILEVTLWTRLGNRDTTHLENKWKEIDDALNGHMHLDATQWLKFEKLSQGMIPDPDANVRRRELRYLIKREERIDY